MNAPIKRQVVAGLRGRWCWLAGGLAVGVVLASAAPVPAAEAGAADEEVLARKILSATGVKGGLIVHLHCGQGRLTAALWGGESFRVHGLDADPARIAAAREYIRSRGLEGKVSVERWSGKYLPYTDNLVNLLVAGGTADVAPEEITRVLAPGGVAYLRGGGKWTRRVKPRPGDIDEWTHYLHGPRNNAVAKDTRVGPPRHMQWKSGPMWCRSHEFTSSIACVVSAGGRLFVIQDEGVIGQPRGVPSLWRLAARDAFNGLLLWKRAISQGNALQRRLVAMGDRVYVPLGGDKPISVLDAATGKEICTLPDSAGATEMVALGDVVLVRRGGGKSKSARRKKAPSGKSGSLAAYDAKTGKALWRRPIANAVKESLAADGGRAFYHDGKQVVALGLSDGGDLWRAACGPGRNLLIYQGVLVVSAGSGLHAFDSASGKPLWVGPRSGEDLFGAAGLIWVAVSSSPGRNVAWTPQPYQCVGLAPRTGERARTITVKNILSPGHHARCYRAKATERFLLQRKRGVEFIDLAGEDHSRNDWLRGPCRHGIVPANGLLYAPPHQCFCYVGARLTGFNVTSARVSPEASRPVPAAERLVHGPAWPAAKVDPAGAVASDWPSFRHDALRSGGATTKLPAKLQSLWEAKVGPSATAPVVAGGRLLIARRDAHTVTCLDARSGKSQWVFTVAGPIDSPPTVHGPLVLFGSRDGRVYCLRAADGHLVWRFQAAPCERRIVSFGQLESAWPVHGSVLVQNGLVYCTAGRSSYLDGGIHAYALEPHTGRVVHQNVIHTKSPNVDEDVGRPFTVDGTRTDVLVSDGEDLYLFRQRLAPDLTCRPMPPLTRLGDSEVGLHLMATDGLLDRSWFNRTYWTYSRRWPGFYFGYRAPKAGQLLVFDRTSVYAVKVFTERRGHSPEFTVGSGYQLVADDVTTEPVLLPHAIGRDKTEGYTRSAPAKWTARIPLRAEAMVLAGDRLVLAGVPDEAPADDPMAAFEGRRGALLWVAAAEDGKKLAEYKLTSPPASDGMIAADGRLYLVTRDGRVTCMGAKP